MATRISDVNTFALVQSDTKITGTVVLNDATGNETALTLNYTTNKATSGNDTGLLINMTDTLSPGTSKPLDIKVGGTSLMYVGIAGKVNAPEFIGMGSNVKLSGGFSNIGVQLSVENFTASSGTYYGIRSLYDGTYGSCTMTGGQFYGFAITPRYNEASGTAANTDLLINRTETAIGSGAQLFIDAQVGGTSKFKIDTAGLVYINTVKVLGDRVIDARCDDVANSGDATTDGLIDALRDAMIAHGLIAAA